MSKITKSARDEECTVRLPTHCNWDTSTTVFAHLGGGGMGKKKRDLFGAYACSNCHGVLDGAIDSALTSDDKELAHRQAVDRTQEILLDKELIKIC